MDAMRKVQKNHGAALAQARKLKEYVLEEFAEYKQIEKVINIFKDYVKSDEIMDNWLASINQVTTL
jgi:hypothetical protein